MCGSEIDIVHVIVSKIVSYKRKLPDCIVHGLWCMEERSKKRCSLMYLRGKMKSDRNITPLLGSMSTATSFVLIHENTQPHPIDHLDALVYAGSG